MTGEPGQTIGDESSVTVLNALGYITSPNQSAISIPKNSDKRLASHHSKPTTTRSSMVSIADESMTIPILPRANLPISKQNMQLKKANISKLDFGQQQTPQFAKSQLSPKASVSPFNPLCSQA